jgi:hypothetical protein
MLAFPKHRISLSLDVEPSSDVRDRRIETPDSFWFQLAAILAVDTGDNFKRWSRLTAEDPYYITDQTDPQSFRLPWSFSQSQRSPVTLSISHRPSTWWRTLHADELCEFDTTCDDAALGRLCWQGNACILLDGAGSFHIPSP